MAKEICEVDARVERILVNQELAGETPHIRNVVPLEVTEPRRKYVVALVGAAFEDAQFFEDLPVLIQAVADVARGVTDRIADHSRLEQSRQGLLVERPNWLASLKHRLRPGMTAKSKNERSSLLAQDDVTAEHVLLPSLRAIGQRIDHVVDRCADQCQRIVVVGGPGAAHALPGCSKRCRRLVGHHPGSALPSDVQGQLRTLVTIELLWFPFSTTPQFFAKISVANQWLREIGFEPKYLILLVEPRGVEPLTS